MRTGKAPRNLVAASASQSQAPRQSAAPSSGREAAEARGGTQTPEALALSEHRDEVQRIRQQLEAVPEVREDRVQALRAQVQSGNYYISDAELASRLLGSQWARTR